MLENPLIRLLLELLRSLVIDEVAARVRERLMKVFARRRRIDRRNAFRQVHRRNCQRLLNRLRTETEDNS